MWGRDEERGRVHGVRFRGLRVTNSVFNPGYSISVIAGHDTEHDVRDVVFEDVYVNGSPVTHPDGIELLTKYADGVRFA
jgi:hypothetical protein